MCNRPSSETQTLAVIPAFHQGRRTSSCSIQLISDDGVWTAEFPADCYRHTHKRISIDENQFGERGIRLAIDKPKLRVRGRLNFGALTPLSYDIMGPFALVPFLECRHSVWSMCHLVNGMVCINGREYVFQNAFETEHASFEYEYPY